MWNEMKPSLIRKFQVRYFNKQGYTLGILRSQKQDKKIFEVIFFIKRKIYKYSQSQKIMPSSRDHTTSIQRQISTKYTVSLFTMNSGAQVCHEYLVSGQHGVPDPHLTASSSWNSHLPNDNNGPDRSRIFTTAYDYGNGTFYRGAWTSGIRDKNQYIQVYVFFINF